MAFSVLFGLALTTQSLAQEQSFDEAQSPSWRILRNDEQGRPVIVDTGTGAQLEVRPSAAPEDVSPTDEQIDSLKTREVMRGQVLMVNPPQGSETQLRAAGYRILERIRMFEMDMEVWRVAIPSDLSEKAAIKQLKQDFPDTIVDANQILDLSAAPVGRDFSRGYVGWGQVPKSCGVGMRIGMLDGAVDVNAAQLRGQRVVFESFTAEGRKPAGYTHGTAVASMLVARPVGDKGVGGMLPGATLFAAGMFEYRGGREVGNLSNMLKAAEWLSKNRVNVVNMSIAGGGNAVMSFVLNKLQRSGIVIVAAAGNNGPKAAPAWPAAHPKVISVTAIDRTLNVYPYANQGGYIDFAAPGVDLVTETRGGLKKQSGTSFAAPFITAMVAIHLDAGFPTDADALRASLQRYTRDLGDPGRDATFGWGLVRLKPQC
ncbi:MAG: S8 family serine peptidase [Alphaproteobacteria bacterium]|nr:S8 family serine peptidase [Alphaproteobacteria bacterium]